MENNLINHKRPRKDIEDESFFDDNGNNISTNLEDKNPINDLDFQFEFNNIPICNKLSELHKFININNLNIDDKEYNSINFNYNNNIDKNKEINNIQIISDTIKETEEYITVIKNIELNDSLTNNNDSYNPIITNYNNLYKKNYFTNNIQTNENKNVINNQTNNNINQNNIKSNNNIYENKFINNKKINDKNISNLIKIDNPNIEFNNFYYKFDNNLNSKLESTTNDDNLTQVINIENNNNNKDKYTEINNKNNINIDNKIKEDTLFNIKKIIQSNNNNDILENISEDNNINEDNNLESFYNNLTFNNNDNNILCNICKKDISKNIKVLCSTCNNIVYCLNCFIKKHHIFNDDNNNNDINQKIYNAHEYQIINKLNFNLFTKDWTANDELDLCEGFIQYGLNNWEDISSKLNKGKLECEAHYKSFYKNNNNSLNPDKNKIILNNNNQINQNKLNINNIINLNILNSLYDTYGLTKKDLDINEYMNNHKELLNYNLANNQKKIKNKIKKLNINLKTKKNLIEKDKLTMTDIKSLLSDRKVKSIIKENIKNKEIVNIADNLGYNEERNEFNYQYKHNIEKNTILTIHEDEELDLEETLQNLLILTKYNKILNERDEIKNFIINNNLLEINSTDSLDLPKNKEDHELYFYAKIFISNYKTYNFFVFVEPFYLLDKINTKLKELEKLELDINFKIKKIKEINLLDNYLKQTEISYNYLLNHFPDIKSSYLILKKDGTYKLCTDKINSYKKRIDLILKYELAKRENTINNLFNLDEIKFLENKFLPISTFYEINNIIISNMEKHVYDNNFIEKINTLINNYDLDIYTHSQVSGYYFDKYKELYVNEVYKQRIIEIKKYKKEKYIKLRKKNNQ